MAGADAAPSTQTHIITLNDDQYRLLKNALSDLVEIFDDKNHLEYLETEEYIQEHKAHLEALKELQLNT